jgi:hypothetical protein
MKQPTKSKSKSKSMPTTKRSGAQLTPSQKLAKSIGSPLTKKGKVR